MKNILITLFLFCSLFGFSQVPNTTTFSLSDVVSNVTGASGNLSSCFSNAVTAKFDHTYNNDSYAPANSMLRFRNYGGVAQINWSYTNTSSYTGGLYIYYNLPGGGSHSLVNITTNGSGTVYAPVGYDLEVFLYNNYPNYPDILFNDLTITNPSYNYSGHNNGASFNWTPSTTNVITITASVTN